MAFTFQELLADPGDSLYYDEAFRDDIEAHLVILRRYNVDKRTVPPSLIYKYEGDFYGYLTEIGVPTEYHWIYLRVNHMAHPREFGEKMRDPQNRNVTFDMIVPDTNAISGIRTLFLTKKR